MITKRIKILISTVLFFIGGAALSVAEEFKLKNNLTVVYEYIPHTQIVSVQSWVKTGSINEDSRINGISHFLEHILFKGTKNFKPDEIDALIDSHGGQTNAGTSKDFTMYYVTIPTEYAETAFSVVSDMVFNASFIPEEIEKEKPVVVQEIQRKFDNPTHDMWQDLTQALYAGTPYAREVIGTENNVNSFTQAMLKEYYQRYYHPENMTLVIVGDIPKSKAKQLAGKYYSQMSAIPPAEGYNKTWKPTLNAKKDRKSAKIKFDKTYGKDVSQEYVTQAYQVNAVAKDAPVYDVLTEMLSGGEYSLLNMELKYKKGLVTAVSAGDMLSKNAGSYMIYLVTNPGDSTKAVTILDGLLREIVAGNQLTSDMMEKAKKRLKSRTVFMKERAANLAHEIGYSYTLNIKDYYHTYNDKIDAVSLADVKKIANEIFSSQCLRYITVPEKL